MKGIMQGVGVAVILLVIAFLVLFPGFRLIHTHPRSKLCYANIRVVLGAIEMYNMDHSDMIKSVGTREMATLLSGKHLNAPIACPGDFVPRFKNTFFQDTLQQISWNFGLGLTLSYPIPPGSYSGRDLDTTGRISCSLHGTID